MVAPWQPEYLLGALSGEPLAAKDSERLGFLVLELLGGFGSLVAFEDCPQKALSCLVSYQKLQTLLKNC